MMFPDKLLYMKLLFQLAAEFVYRSGCVEKLSFDLERSSLWFVYEARQQVLF